MVGGGGHLGQRQARVTPGHHVAGAGDVDLRGVAAALDRAGLEDLEQFGMERTPVKLKSQLRHFRPDGEHADTSLIARFPGEQRVPALLPHYTSEGRRREERFGRGSYGRVVEAASCRFLPEFKSTAGATRQDAASTSGRLHLRMRREGIESPFGPPRCVDAAAGADPLAARFPSPCPATIPP